MSYTIEYYRPELQPQWDSVVRSSRNGTFLHLRGYMDYHADRFADRSLVVCDSAGKICALLPAAVPAGVDTDTVTSHPGLTYGGLLLPLAADGADVLEMMDAIVQFYSEKGYKSFVYKPVPHIYHKFPCEEDLYAIFRLKAMPAVWQLSSTFPYPGVPVRNENTRRNIAKGIKNGITICESDDYAAFHAMLSANLAARHDAAPVHSLAEIELLASRFPDNIRLWMAKDASGTPAAAVLMYITDTCAHTQYIASTADGRRLRAVPALLAHLIDVYSHLRYFDFGTCNEDSGRYLNEGLMRQKNGFGARGTVYTSFKIDLTK